MVREASTINQIPKNVCPKRPTDPSALGEYDQLEDSDGVRRPLTKEEKIRRSLLPPGARVYTDDNPTSRDKWNRPAVTYIYDGQRFHPGANRSLESECAGRHEPTRVVSTPAALLPKANYATFATLNDFAFKPITNLWGDKLVPCRIVLIQRYTWSKQALRLLSVVCL